ncbi:MAG: hypothetical protein JEZ14_00275 [Marinilabiliaceae bacterium]|nr:hypothetical protein [Marinilabiliaceae bacterium]
MIPKIVQRTRNAEINTVATRIYADLSQRDFTTDPYMTTQIAALHGNNEMMKQALNENSTGSTLAPKDEKRDASLRVIYYEVQAKTHWPLESIKKDALTVMDVLDNYGIDTAGLSYADESANINALLEDFKKIAIATAIQNLPGLEELITVLQNDQKDFETAYLQAVDQKLENKKLASATSLNKLLCKQINDGLVVYLNAMALAQPATYKACAEVVAVIIDENNRRVRNRLREKETVGSN